MAAGSEKSPGLPVISHVSLLAFLNGLRDAGRDAFPNRIDKTLMSKASGSQQAGTLAALRFFNFIDEQAKPTEEFTALVFATDEERKPLFEKVIRARYKFLFEGAGNFAIERATSGEAIEEFRKQNITGSTVTKSMTFFLAAAKDAGIKVSSHIKAPPAPKSNSGARKVAKRKDEEEDSPADEVDEEDDLEGSERFEIPIPGKKSVRVIVPSDLDALDWEMLQSMITVYIKRWKGFANAQSNPSTNKSGGDDD